MAFDLNCNSPFDLKYGPLLRGRYWTMRIALNLLSQQPNRNIVETGCQRRANDYGNGSSTYIFGEFLKDSGHLTTIDISYDNITACEEITKEFSNITYINDDSLRVLPYLTDPVDLLYLDSYDIPEVGDASEGQAHNLKEFKAAEHLLHPGSLVMIDDNNMLNGGKSKLTKPYLIERGYKLILDYDQSLWLAK